MAHPAFIDRLRQRNSPAEEQPDLPPRVAFDSSNPFDRAATDLAVRWDAMVVDLEAAQAEAEFHRGENVHLASEVDRLRQELATRISFFEVELDRLQKRADRAVDENSDRRGKLEIISKALLMVLNETLAAAPINREPDPVREVRERPAPRNLSTIRVSGVKPPTMNGDYIQTPAEGFETSKEDAEDARDLINRIAPVALKR